MVVELKWAYLARLQFSLQLAKLLLQLLDTRACFLDVSLCRSDILLHLLCKM